jgi:hypothetical protein
MTADITSSQLELVVMGVAVVLILALAGVRAYRRKRYRSRRAAGQGYYDRQATLAPGPRAAGVRQPTAPSFSSTSADRSKRG